jgi:hypothetical protein
MDIMAYGGWLRIRREPKCFVISSPDNLFLEQTITGSDIQTNCFPSIDYGFHMYETRIQLDSIHKLVKHLANSMITGKVEVPKCSEPFAQARLKLFNGLSYPEHNSVSGQEYAAGASIHAKKADTWRCECGRYVLNDGLPCFCGEPSHYSRGKSR